MTTRTITAIHTDPKYGWPAELYQPARPWAVATITDGKVVFVHARYASQKTANNQARKIREINAVAVAKAVD